ncbi:MAG TPA: hypothetical protein VG452_08725 [Egibacteraceae bacterium]|nr:hypothetical protein [Egibacteraceae bacterium]
MTDGSNAGVTVTVRVSAREAATGPEIPITAVPPAPHVAAGPLPRTGLALVGLLVVAVLLVAIGVALLRARRPDPTQRTYYQ